jgi:UDP-N-acetylglucosamine--N-acetylmuramyl-(pentapeptide) pyrophosphoryl-undecaprenol N-acetylglucosamine transferase
VDGPRRELRCLIAAGGTAGHVLPALAVAEALSARGVSVSFAGSPDRGERDLVASAGYPFDVFRIGGIPRELSARAVRAIVTGVRAPAAVGRIIDRRAVDVVLGAGGYAGGPAVVAAALRRIPAALTEADAHLGLANRLAAPFAKRVFLAYPIAGLDGSKFEVTGRPIPKRSRLPTGGKTEARARFGLPVAGPLVLVCGGSLGARRLNDAAVEAWAETGPAVLHLAGERDEPSLADRVRREDYRLLGLTDDFGAALAAADLVVSRAGGVVWEIAAAGRPALLVPYPHATADHQTRNARFFADGGGALLVHEPDLDLARQAGQLLCDPARLERMSAAMLRLARPDAAETVAAGLIELATGRA